jgi:hypothetical protein
MSKIILIINNYYKAIFQLLSRNVLYLPSLESVRQQTMRGKWFCMSEG